jgi:hypothetical protein
MGDDPTPYFAGAFSNRLANLRKRRLASEEQHGTRESQIDAGHDRLHCKIAGYLTTSAHATA